MTEARATEVMGAVQAAFPTLVADVMEAGGTYFVYVSDDDEGT